MGPVVLLQLLVLSPLPALFIPVSAVASFRQTHCSHLSGWRLKTPLAPVAAAETSLTSVTDTSGHGHPQPQPHFSHQENTEDREWNYAEREKKIFTKIIWEDRTDCTDQVLGSAGQAWWPVLFHTWLTPFTPLSAWLPLCSFLAPLTLLIASWFDTILETSPNIMSLQGCILISCEIQDGSLWSGSCSFFIVN